MSLTQFGPLRMALLVIAGMVLAMLI